MKRLNWLPMLALAFCSAIGGGLTALWGVRALGEAPDKRVLIAKQILLCDENGKDRINLKVDQGGASIRLVDRNSVAVIDLHVIDALAPAPPSKMQDGDYLDKLLRAGSKAMAGISVGDLNGTTLTLSGDHIMMDGFANVLEIGNILARPAVGRFGFGVMRSGGGEGVWSTIGEDQPSINIFDSKGMLRSNLGVAHLHNARSKQDVTYPPSTLLLLDEDGTVLHVVP